MKITPSVLTASFVLSLSAFAGSGEVSGQRAVSPGMLEKACHAIITGKLQRTSQYEASLTEAYENCLTASDAHHPADSEHERRQDIVSVDFKVANDMLGCFVYLSEDDGSANAANARVERQECFFDYEL